MAALEGYINDTSSALFALAARIAARPSEEIDHLARHAGLALGHRAGDRDAAAGCRRGGSCSCRCNCCEQHGSGMEEVFAGKQTPKLRAALDQLIGEAQRRI